MSTTPVRRAGLALGLAIALSLSGGCATTPGSADHAPPPSSAPTTAPAQRDPEAPDREALATTALSAAERSKLGLPPLGQVVDTRALAPLANAQWADPGAVSARLAVLQTNYRASEAPRDVRARWLPYLAPRLAEDLGGSDAGAAALADLRTQDAVFTGEVLGLAVDEQSRDRAVVRLSIRRSVVTGDGSIEPQRVAFWVVTVVHDPATDRWLVVQVGRS